MKKQLNKRLLVLLAIGLNFIFWGMTLNNFGIIGDGFTGFLTGIGIGLEIVALIKAKKIKAKNHKQCDLRLD